MLDEIIVTLQTENGISCDWALPGTVTLGELYPRLLAALQQYKPGYFADWNGICLETEEGALTDMAATLLDYGVCSGYYLTAVQEA